MATSTADWIDELKGISVLELAERIKALEEEFGVSATAVAAAAPAAGGGGGDAAAEEESSTVDVVLTGLGKSVKIAVFAKGDKAREAEEAGADVVGADDLAKQIEEGFDDFDVAIATPDMMPVVGRLGRILGPSGKMPNPKVGTVTMDVAKAVEESKAGKIEYRTDRTAIVHLNIGKTSFEEQALLENYAAVIDEIIKAKPAAAKGRYIRSITVTSTMGPGVKVDPARTKDILEEASLAAAAA